MATETSICNAALNLLGSSNITSIDDDNTKARLCKSNYDELRQAVLEEGNWSFAMRRYKLEIQKIKTDDD